MTELAPPPARVSHAGLDPEAAGVTLPANPGRHGGFLTDVVVELGFADRAAVEKAEEAARSSGQTIERSLVGSGILDEEQLALTIAERNGLDHVDLERFAVDMEAAEMIGRSTALRYRAAPIAFAADGALVVAVEDPYNSLAITDIEAMTRSEVRPVIATGSGIQSLIERLREEPAIQAPPPPPPPSQPPSSSQPPPPSQSPSPPSHLPAVEAEEPLPEPPAPPRSEPSPNGGANRSADLEALREAVRRADALAGAVGERIAELEGADERARKLEQELAIAQERIAELEQRLARFGAAAQEAAAAIEKLSVLQGILEETGP